MQKKFFVEGYPEELYTMSEIITQKVSREGWELKEQENGLPKIIDDEGVKRSLLPVDEEAFEDEDRVIYSGSSADEIYEALEECLDRKIGVDGHSWLDVVFEVDGKVSAHYQVLDIHHNLTKLTEDRSVRATDAVEEWGLEIQEKKDTEAGEYCTATYDSESPEEHAFVIDDLLNQVYGKDLTEIQRLRLRPEGKVYIFE
jgi:hypothetical protein